MGINYLSRITPDDATARIGRIELLLSGVSVIIGLSALAAIAAGKVEWQAFGKIPALLGIIGAVGAGLYFASKYTSEVLLGRVGVLLGLLGGVSAVIGAASLAAIAAGKMPWNALVKIPALLTELGLIVAGLSAISLLLTGPQAAIIIPGVFALEGLMGGLAIVIGAAALAALAYGRAERNVTDLPGVGSRIGKMLGGFVSGISDVITLSLVAKLPAIAAFGVALMPVLLSLSLFIDVIGKFGNLKRPIGFDSKGKPTGYESFSPDDFTKASNVISSAFDAFIGGLYNHVKQYGLWSSIITGVLGVAMLPIMKAVSKFTNAIIKLSTGTYTVTDSTGNSVTKKISPQEMSMAAGTIVSWFSTFIQRMISDTKNLKLKKDIVIGTFGLALFPIFMAVGNFINSIMELASGTYKVTDTTGNTVIKKISTSDMQMAASGIVNYFSTFIKSLIESVKGLGFFRQMAITSLSHAILPVMKSVALFSDTIIKAAAGLFTFTGTDGKLHQIKVTQGQMAGAAKSISDNFSVFIHSLVNDISDLGFWKERTLSEFASNITPVMDSVSKFVSMISVFAISRGGQPLIAVISGYDKAGHPVFATEGGRIRYVSVGRIGTLIGRQFTDFVRNISNGLSAKGLSDSASSALSILKDSITPIFSEMQKYVSVFSSYAEGNIYLKIPQIMRVLVGTIAGIMPMLNGDGTKSPHRIPRFGSQAATDNIKNYMNSISEISGAFDIARKFSDTSVSYSTIVHNAREYVDFLHVLADQSLPQYAKSSGKSIAYLCGRYREFDRILVKNNSLIVSGARNFKSASETIGKSLDDVYNNHKKQIDYFVDKTDSIAKNLTIVNENLKSISANGQAKQDLYYLADSFHEMTMQEINMLSAAMSQMNTSLGGTALGTNIPNPAASVSTPLAGNAANNVSMAASAPTPVTLSGPFVFRTDKGGILMKGELDANS